MRCARAARYAGRTRQEQHSCLGCNRNMAAHTSNHTVQAAVCILNPNTGPYCAVYACARLPRLKAALTPAVTTACTKFRESRERKGAIHTQATDAAYNSCTLALSSVAAPNTHC